ncbi:MAG: peptidoglycan-binding protein [Brasilonema angustatum HA4187-MV1]|jgi:peptidoglycan hydrolase-like protein with peptidoglycan-binding domain|nr:peptidoglycan-binding protein [Brasilonema angustatum HA4187-MV1]
MADASLPVLQKGATGSTVALLQTFLRIKGYGTSTNPTLQLHVDGIFGDTTDSVVRQFQKNSHLNVDGVVGDKTWQAFVE